MQIIGLVHYIFKICDLRATILFFFFENVLLRIIWLIIVQFKRVLVLSGYD